MAQVGVKKPIRTDGEERPFLGLRSFEEKNKAQFGGRDQDIRRLFNLIENRALTVVFGKSGIGKTSLIKAGIMPELRQNFYYPIYIRIDYSASKPPLKQLKDGIYKEMSKKDPSVPKIREDTLWDYFHNVKLVDGLLTPVLILDQFEETFTLGDANIRDVLEMIIELADLAENQIPVKVQQEYRQKNETIPSYYGQQPYRVVLSLREDYLARLEELKRYIPSIMDSRFRVLQMTVEQALDAALKPGKGILEEEVAAEIIKKLPGVSQSDFDFLHKKDADRSRLKVEPFLLSLICDRINERRIEKKLPKITHELVAGFNVKDVIYSFYNETIRKHGGKVQRAIEDRLLTEGGFRKLQALEELQKEYQIEDTVIDELVDARILRKELRDGIEYAELIHDVLSPVIKEARDVRIEQEKEKKRREALERARAIARAKRSRKIQAAAIIVLTILGLTIWTAISSYNEKQNLQRKTNNMALARKLLFTSQSLGAYSGEHKKAALFARVAYLINENNKSGEIGEDMYDQFFYNAMYEALRSVPDNRVEIDRGGKDLKSMEYVEPDEIYVGLKDGTVKDLANSSTLYDFNPKPENLRRSARERGSVLSVKSLSLAGLSSRPQPKNRVTSLAWHKDAEHNLLAMAGISDEVVIYDLDRDTVFKKIPIPQSKASGKVIEFTKAGELVLNQRESLVKWDHPFQTPLRWKAREVFNWNDTTQTHKESEEESIVWEQEVLKIPKNASIPEFMNVFSCFSVGPDGTLAIGIYGGLVFLKDNAYSKLEFADIGTVSAIEFHPSGRSLIMGNDKGEVFELALGNGGNFLPKKYQFQTEKINDIDYHLNDSLVATASDDGTVVIWNRFEGTSFPPFNSIMVGYKNLGAVNSVAFTPDRDFVLAGYNNGTILKWPIRIQKLAQLICEEVGARLSDEDWQEHLEESGLRKSDYECPVRDKMDED